MLFSHLALQSLSKTVTSLQLLWVQSWQHLISIQELKSRMALSWIQKDSKKNKMSQIFRKCIPESGIHHWKILACLRLCRVCFALYIHAFKYAWIVAKRVLSAGCNQQFKDFSLILQLCLCRKWWIESCYGNHSTNCLRTTFSPPYFL